MRKISLRFIFLSAALLVGCGNDGAQLKAAQQAPVFELPQLEGDPIKFPEQLKGKVVALRFWADWCPYCATEMEALEPVYQQYKDQGLVILAINVKQSFRMVKYFAGTLGVSYNILMDQSGEVAEAYGVLGLPATFFVDDNGAIGNRILGESTPETFEKILLDMMGDTH